MGKVLVLIKWNVDSRGWAAIDVRLFYMFDFNHEPVVVYITNINKDSFCTLSGGVIMDSMNQR